MSPASAFILAQALAPEVSWGRERRVGQVEGVGGEKGSEEMALRNQKPVERSGRLLNNIYTPGRWQ